MTPFTTYQPADLWESLKASARGPASPVSGGGVHGVPKATLDPYRWGPMQGAAQSGLRGAVEVAKKGVAANELAEAANRSKLTDVPEGVAGAGRVSPFVGNSMLGLVLSGMRPLMGDAVDPLFRTPGEQAERTARRVTAPLTAPIEAAREYLRPGSTERAQQQASIAEQERKERAMQETLYANAPVIDPAESKRLEAGSATAALQRPTITTEDGRTRVTVPGAIGEASFAANDARSARLGQSARLGGYTPPSVAPEEQVRRNMIATQAGISSDYVPVAERVNELNRATRAVRNLRAANLGLNEGLFDLAGGDASQTRRYQRAMEAAIARGAPIFGGRGGAGGGLGAAYGDMMEKAAAAKTPESLISKKGAEFVNVGTDPMNPQTQATMDIVSKFGREPTPQEMMTIGNQMAMLQRGFTQQEHPLAATPGMVASLESAEGAWYNPLNWFRDDTYYKGKTRSGKSFETGFGYNPYLEEAALGFRPPR